MTFTRGIVAYMAIVLLALEAVAAVVACWVFAPGRVLDLVDDHDGASASGKAQAAVAVGIAFFVLLGAVIVIWALWACRDLRTRLRGGGPERTGLIGAAGLHVAVTAAALLFPLVLAVTLPVLAVLVGAYWLTRGSAGSAASEESRESVLRSSSAAAVESAG
ncbi:hypothetical protein [Streptomyces sp. SID3343]|uniref:hypothetical protein n=1 Tax=Streptomyces sp. SID3343 TaxID=2690260 RepID=UPI00136B299F|nr:hypothetical protein [Streptomyces sp. SID3343]MYW04028.1 hypothetical protein [Streptomyces sp. SID3343]